MSYFCSSAEEGLSLATWPACGDFRHDTSVTSSTLPGILHIVPSNKAGLSAFSYTSSLPLLSLVFGERPDIHPLATKTYGSTLANRWLLSTFSIPILHRAPSQVRNAEALLPHFFWKKCSLLTPFD